jgi:hypothetical protein
MSAIPLHLQRRFEQKWASRFAVLAASSMSKLATPEAAPSTPKGRAPLRQQRQNKKPKNTSSRRPVDCKIDTVRGFGR